MSLPYINNNDLWKVSRKYEETTHHILAKFMGWTNSKENLIKLFDPVHKSYHRLFGTAEIQEVLLQILKINWKALNEEFINDINNIIKESDKRYYYKNGVYLEKSK
jgi:hypothetical protein